MTTKWIWDLKSILEILKTTISGPNYQSNPMEREKHIWDLKGEIENRYALTLRSTRPPLAMVYDTIT